MPNSQSDTSKDCWKIAGVRLSWKPRDESGLSGQRFPVGHCSNATSHTRSGFQPPSQSRNYLEVCMTYILVLSKTTLL